MMYVVFLILLWSVVGVTVFRNFGSLLRPLAGRMSRRSGNCSDYTA